MKSLIKFIKTKYSWYLIMLPVVINAIVWGIVFGGHWYYENEKIKVFQDGFEVGHFAGLNEGYINGYETAVEESYSGMSNNPKVVALFKKYFPEKDIAKTMRAISLSESKGKQTTTFKQNKDGSWDCGFFQINTIHRSAGISKTQFCNEMHDLEKNFSMARKVYNDRLKMFGNGFTAWSDYNNGKYLSYLK